MQLPLQSYFRPLSTVARQHPRLDYPLFPPPRMAVLGCEVQPLPGIYSLLEWTADDVARIRPLALAAAFPVYEELAGWMRRGELALPDLQYPLLVFSRPEAGVLSQSQHDALWAWFGLPCFEQIRGHDGSLLAQECEARDGFHLAQHIRASSLGGHPLDARCACGQVSPRVWLRPSLALAANSRD